MTDKSKHPHYCVHEYRIKLAVDGNAFGIEFYGHLLDGLTLEEVRDAASEHLGVFFIPVPNGVAMSCDIMDTSMNADMKSQIASASAVIESLRRTQSRMS